jgi:hypothetical protein
MIPTPENSTGVHPPRSGWVTDYGVCTQRAANTVFPTGVCSLLPSDRVTSSIFLQDGLSYSWPLNVHANFRIILSISKRLSERSPCPQTYRECSCLYKVTKQKVGNSNVPRPKLRESTVTNGEEAIALRLLGPFGKRDKAATDGLMVWIMFPTQRWLTDAKQLHAFVLCIPLRMCFI